MTLPQVSILSALSLFSPFSTSHSSTLLSLKPDLDFSWGNPHSWERACCTLFKKALSHFSVCLCCVYDSLKEILFWSYPMPLIYSPGSRFNFLPPCSSPVYFLLFWVPWFPIRAFECLLLPAPYSPSPSTPAQALWHLVPTCAWFFALTRR